MTLLAAGVLSGSGGCGRLPGAAETTAAAGTDAVTEVSTETSREIAKTTETEIAEAAEAENTEAAKTIKATSGTSASLPVFAVLPTRYDAREYGRTAAVKNQGTQGTCWAFASLLALESYLLPGETYDFSEDHMTHNPSFALEESAGGDYTMSMAYLASWRGPVLEQDDPYGDGISPENLAAVKHVQEIRMLPEGDVESIKRSVLDFGGVQSSLYTNLREAGEYSEFYNQETRAYCCPDDRKPNHDVVIVGWDDNYPKENFKAEVSRNGAFLCENSWGTQFGEDGFFYVSYEDANLGKTNICYSRVEDVGNYDNIYQSDLCGWIGQLGYGREDAWGVNVYQTGDEPEQLGAVGFYATNVNTDYEVYLVPKVSDDPTAPDSHTFEMRRKVASGHLDYAGYYSIPLEQAARLEANQRFGVMIRLVTPDAIHPIAIEYDAGDGKCRIDLGDGEGYISPDGVGWERVEEKQNCNLCLKAYTSKVK